MEQARRLRAAAAGVLASASTLLLLAWLDRQRRRRRTERRRPPRGVTDEEPEEPVELQCSICATVFRDPVVTTRGFTYERSALLDYWRSAGCANGLRDPQSGNQLVEEYLVTNWQVRHLVERFLREHPGYTPKGWPDAALPPPTQQADERMEQSLPNGLRLGDVVVCTADRKLADGSLLQKGEVGKVLGWRRQERRIRCSFLSLDGAVGVDPSEITKQNLPGGFKVGDSVVSLIHHSSQGRCIHRGEVGRVIAQASANMDVRLKVDFPSLRGLDVHPEQICPESLPGGYSLDSAVVSLIAYFAVAPDGHDVLKVARGEQGKVVGQANTDRRVRLKVDFEHVKGLDILPCQIAPLALPGGFSTGDRVVSLINHDSEGMRLRRGDVGFVAGRARSDPVQRLRVDFPDMRDLDIFPAQVARE